MEKVAIHIEIPVEPFPELEKELSDRFPAHSFVLKKTGRLIAHVEEHGEILEGFVRRRIARQHHFYCIDEFENTIIKQSLVGLMSVIPGSPSVITGMASGILVTHKERWFVATAGHNFFDDGKPRHRDTIDVLIYFQKDLVVRWREQIVLEKAQHCLDRDGRNLLMTPYTNWSEDCGDCQPDVGLIEVRNPQLLLDANCRFWNVSHPRRLIDKEARILVSGWMPEQFDDPRMTRTNQTPTGTETGLPCASIDTTLEGPFSYEHPAFDLQYKTIGEAMEFRTGEGEISHIETDGRPPRPSGMSGGPIWAQVDEDDLEQPFQLIGLFTGWSHREQEIQRATGYGIGEWVRLADEYIQANPSPYRAV